MKKLNLTNAEFANLREIYVNELEKTQKRLEHLQSVLKKLEVDLEEETIVPDKLKNIVKDVVKVQGKSNTKRPKKVLSKPAKASKSNALTEKTVDVKNEIVTATKIDDKPKAKRGRKPKGEQKPLKRGTGKSKVKWNDFVMDTLKRLNAPSLSSNIAAEAVYKFKTPQADIGRVKLVISGALSKLVNTEKKLLTQKIPGSREKLYGLREWFNDKGELLPEYSKK
jgi:hypothetical protein